MDILQLLLSFFYPNLLYEILRRHINSFHLELLLDILRCHINYFHNKELDLLDAFQRFFLAEEFLSLIGFCYINVSNRVLSRVFIISNVVELQKHIQSSEEGLFGCCFLFFRSQLQSPLDGEVETVVVHVGLVVSEGLDLVGSQHVSIEVEVGVQDLSLVYPQYGRYVTKHMYQQFLAVKKFRNT